MHYLFQLGSFEELEEVQEKLLQQGFDHLYTLQDEDCFQLGAYHTEDLEIDLPLIKKESTPQIDWTLEWATHAPHFKDGLVQYPLNNKTLLMQPGPGFGDLSHPTTQLCLDALKNKVNHHAVLDLGSGSGVLSLAASLLGAKKVIGVEIDPAAIEHANANLQLNQLDNVIFTDSLPQIDEENLICLLNMTLEEQRNLIQSYPQLLTLKATWVISGLLEGQAKATAQSGEWILTTSLDHI